MKLGIYKYELNNTDTQVPYLSLLYIDLLAKILCLCLLLAYAPLPSPKRKWSLNGKVPYDTRYRISNKWLKIALLRNKYPLFMKGEMVSIYLILSYSFPIAKHTSIGSQWIQFSGFA